MPWVKLDDRFSEHPKWGNADAFEVQWFIFALCYCNRNLTNGFVPFGVAARLIDVDEHLPTEALPRRVIERLLASDVLEQVAGGYLIKGYLEYQRSKADVLREREAAAKRQGVWRGNTRKSNGQNNAVSNGGSNGPVTPAPNPNPIPNKKERTKHVPTDAGTPEDFLTFWALYPKKDARKDALKAWRQVQPKNGTVDAIMTNVSARIASGEWTSKKPRVKFVPLAGTYLRGERWTDSSPLGASGPEPSAKALEQAKEHYRKVNGCQHEPKHTTYAECVRFLAESWQ